MHSRQYSTRYICGLSFSCWVLTKIVREPVYPRRRSFESIFSSTQHHHNPSTGSPPISKHIRGVHRTRSGWIANPVTKFFVGSHTCFSDSLPIGSFFDLCTVSADTSKLPKPKLKSPRGGHYYTVSFEVVLLFGLTELTAQLSWMDNGIEMRWVCSSPIQPHLLKTSRGPARIIYDQVDGIAEACQ